MLNFNIQKIEEVENKILEHNSLPENERNSPFWLEWLIIYLEFKEALTSNEIEKTFKLKLEIIETHWKSFAFFLKNNLNEAIQISSDFFMIKIIEAYVFLETDFKDKKKLDFGIFNEEFCDSELINKLNNEIQTKKNLLWIWITLLFGSSESNKLMNSILNQDYFNFGDISNSFYFGKKNIHEECLNSLKKMIVNEFSKI